MPGSLKQSEPVLNEDGEPRTKRRRISHNAKFKAEVSDSKEGSLLTREVIKMCKSFRVDKTKVTKGLKNKEEIVKAVTNIEKKKLLKICQAFRVI